MPRNRTALLARAIGILSVVIGLVAIGQQPASAITDGQRDTVHTNVGLVRFTTAEGRFRCSGTLISPTWCSPRATAPGDRRTRPRTSTSRSTPTCRSTRWREHHPEESAARAAHYITGTAHPDPNWDGKL